VKTILVPFHQDGLPAAVLDTACLFARRFDAYIEGLPFDFVPAEYVAVDLFGGGWVPPSENELRENAAVSRRMFEDYMIRHGVSRTDGSMSTFSFGWRSPGQQNLSIAELSRIFDITVFSRPSPPAIPSLRLMLEATLFEGGRSILVAPPTAPRTIGEHVLIAWNCSTETARTVALAMPILSRATQVTVLTVVGGTVSGPAGTELTSHLRANGVPATEMTVTPARSTGEEILEQCQKLGCDLIIKGAYTQSRFRQMIFGGATSHILSATQTPVFMAH
jgi:nucleotide-binding universal stress UspA family protein